MDSDQSDPGLNGRTATGCLIKLVPTRKGGSFAHLPNYFNTSSQGKGWSKELSPFFVGPVELYGNHVSQTVENAWQYAKVYKSMADENEDPSDKYWQWAEEGWANPKAKRFPLGKGQKPLYSYWDGEKLGYMEARLRIYCACYASAVVKTEAFQNLKKLTEENKEIILSDPDAPLFPSDTNKSLKDLLFNTAKPLSHSVVLALLLCDRPIWENWDQNSQDGPSTS